MELEAPTTIHDFERMILQTPNSSLVWVQFMAFWVSSMQIEKAREIAGKALKVHPPHLYPTHALGPQSKQPPFLGHVGEPGSGLPPQHPSGGSTEIWFAY